MTNEELLNRVEELAGDQRRTTFRKAVECILSIQVCHAIVETGTYRGIPGDGESTMILNTVSTHLRTHMWSVDISEDHYHQSQNHIGDSPFFHPVLGDSVAFLRDCELRIDFLYLDSWDYDPTNPYPCQIHQAAELAAAFGKLSPSAVVLMDDAALPDEGKTKLSSAILEKLGFRRVADAYQRLYVR